MPRTPTPLQSRPGAPEVFGGRMRSSESKRAVGRVIARRYHFSMAGVAYAATTCVLVVGAVNGQNNLLFWLFGLAVAGLVVSGVLSGWGLMGLLVTRVTGTRGRVGERLPISYIVENRNRLVPGFGLFIEELEEARDWWFRPVHASVAPRATLPVASVAQAPVRERVRTDAGSVALRRGVVRPNIVRVSSSFPFGMTRKSVTWVAPGEVLIWPRKVDLAQRVLPPAPGLGDGRGGVRPSRTGDEFLSLREYRPGDSVRNVAWRASARTETPLVRVLGRPPGQRLWIRVDDTVGADEAFELILAAAGSLAERSLEIGYEVGLADGAGGVVLEPRGGVKQAEAILDALALWERGPRERVPARRRGRGEEQITVTCLAAGRGQSGRAVFADDPRTYESGAVPGAVGIAAQDGPAEAGRLEA